jgi:hypothetical protein
MQTIKLGQQVAAEEAAHPTTVINRVIPGGDLLKRRKRHSHIRIWTGEAEHVMDTGEAYVARFQTELCTRE